MRLGVILQLVITFFASQAFGGSAQTVTVGPNSEYPSIAAALSQPFIGDGTKESERDTIIVADGVYPSSSTMSSFVDVSNKNYVTIKTQTPGNVTITPSDGILFRWINSKFVKIYGIVVTGGAGFGAFFFDNNFVIEDCKAEKNSSFGIRFGGDADKSSGAGGHSNLIKNCIFSWNGSSTDGGHHGILIQNTSATSWDQRTIIDKCEISNNGEDGIQTAGAVDNSHADENHIAAYIEIKNCKINDNGENGIDLKASRYVRLHHNEICRNHAAAIVIHSPENTGAAGNIGSFKCAIYNNLIANNLSRGIQTGDGDYSHGTYNLIFNNIVVHNVYGGIWAAGGKKVEGDVVFCNTVVNTCGSGTGSWTGGWGIPYEETGKENYVINNIVWGNNNPGFKSIHTFIKLNNLLDNDGQNWDNNFYTTDPKFLDPSSGNYALAADSPAKAHPFSGQILTSEKVQEYKTLLGRDLPITKFGPTIDFNDSPRINNYPGAIVATVPVIREVIL